MVGVIVEFVGAGDSTSPATRSSLAVPARSSTQGVADLLSARREHLSAAASSLGPLLYVSVVRVHFAGRVGRQQAAALASEALIDAGTPPSPGARPTPLRTLCTGVMVMVHQVTVAAGRAAEKRWVVLAEVSRDFLERSEHISVALKFFFWSEPQANFCCAIRTATTAHVRRKFPGGSLLRLLTFLVRKVSYSTKNINRKNLARLDSLALRASPCL